MLSKSKFIRSRIGQQLQQVNHGAIPHNLCRKKGSAVDKRSPDFKKLDVYFNSAPHLQEIKQYIPSKYLEKRLHRPPQNLYLFDSEIAKDITSRILPSLKSSEKHLICETNAGLGLITSELLDNGIDRIRLYESCMDFRRTLKTFNNVYPGRVELFVKDIFGVPLLSYLDKFDRADRVEQLLKGVPRRKWEDGPAMTIIGTMPTLVFLKYLMKMLALQSEIITYGRPRLFAIMRPGDYVRLTSKPPLDLHVYTRVSIYFQTFFDCNKLAEYPREAFHPWERVVPARRTRIDLNMYDVDHMYLVEINMKPMLPLTTEQILQFYIFIKQVFSKPTNPIIPILEKWIPDIGIDVISPQQDFCSYFEDMSLYTSFGELSPKELVSLFKVMYCHAGYKSGLFVPIVEDELLKSESVETDSAVETPSVVEDLEEKLDV